MLDYWPHLCVCIYCFATMKIMFYSDEIHIENYDIYVFHSFQLLEFLTLWSYLNDICRYVVAYLHLPMENIILQQAF